MVDDLILYYALSLNELQELEDLLMKNQSVYVYPDLNQSVAYFPLCRLYTDIHDDLSQDGIFHDAEKNFKISVCLKKKI